MSRWARPSPGGSTNTVRYLFIALVVFGVNLPPAFGPRRGRSSSSRAGTGIRTPWPWPCPVLPRPVWGDACWPTGHGGFEAGSPSATAPTSLPLPEQRLVRRRSSLSVLLTLFVVSPRPQRSCSARSVCSNSGSCPDGRLHGRSARHLFAPSRCGDGRGPAMGSDTASLLGAAMVDCVAAALLLGLAALPLVPRRRDRQTPPT